MWSELTNFGFKRTKKQAFGFYLAYLVLIMLIGFVVGAASSVITGMDSFSAGVKVGTVVALIACVYITYQVVQKKNLFSFGYLLLILLSGALAVTAGGILGLIVPAVITTKDLNVANSGESTPVTQ